MSAITDILGLKELPSPITARELILAEAVRSYHPLFVELESITGPLDQFVQSASEEDMFRAAWDFMNAPQRSEAPLDGGLDPVPNNLARRNLAVWSTHQTLSGGLNPFVRGAVEAYPDLAKSPVNLRIALFVAKSWALSRPLPFTWDAVSRSIHRGLEGSNRTRAGKSFESAIRAACDLALHREGLHLRACAKERRVRGPGGVVRVDVVIEGPAMPRLIPCKFTQRSGREHVTSVMRDLRDGMNQLEASDTQVLVALGGPGWDQVAGDLGLPFIWEADPLPADDIMIEALSEKILDSGLLSGIH